jgi:hypothetical protein
MKHENLALPKSNAFRHLCPESISDLERPYIVVPKDRIADNIQEPADVAGD